MLVREFLNRVKSQMQQEAQVPDNLCAAKNAIIQMTDSASFIGPQLSQADMLVRIGRAHIKTLGNRLAGMMVHPEPLEKLLQLKGELRNMRELLSEGLRSWMRLYGLTRSHTIQADIALLAAVPSLSTTKDPILTADAPQEHSRDLKTRLESYIGQAKAQKQEMTKLQDRISEIEEDIRSGQPVRPIQQRQTGLKVDDYTVIAKEDRSRDEHDCAVRCLVEIIQDRSPTTLTVEAACDYILRKVYARGQTHVAQVVGKFKNSQQLEAADRLQLKELEAILDPFIYAIRTWEGWELYSTAGVPDGTRPSLGWHYATPIIIVDDQQQHLTGGHLTVSREDLAQREGYGSASITLYLPGREDNHKYGMRSSGLNSAPGTRLVRAQGLEEEQCGIITAEAAGTIYVDQSSPSDHCSNDVHSAVHDHRELETTKSKIRQDNTLEPMEGLAPTLVTPVAFFRTPGIAGTLRPANTTSTPAASRQRHHQEIRMEWAGRSGGLTLKVTKGLLKNPELKTALAEPDHTPDKVMRLVQAQEEAGLLFGIPYSQPATLSVVADGLCGLHAIGQHARLLLRDCNQDTPTTFRPPIVELIRDLPEQQTLTRSESTMEAYSKFLRATLALHNASSKAEQLRIRQLMGEQYDVAIADVQRLARMVSDPKFSRTSAAIGMDHWQKGYVLSFLSATNHLPIEIYGTYQVTSGRLETRRLRLEQRYDGTSNSLDVPMTVNQLNNLLNRSTGGIGLVDNHFYLLGSLSSLASELQPALRHLAEQLISAAGEVNNPKRRRKPSELTDTPTSHILGTLAATPHSDEDAASYGLFVRSSIIGAGRGLFTTHRIPVNRKITVMPGLSLSREMQYLIAQTKTEVSRFQNVLSSWNGRAVDPGGMERYHYYGHLANTALAQEQCNAEYRWASTEEYPGIYSTCPIGANAEIVVSYGSRAPTALFFMHPERLVHLREEEQQKFIDDYQEEIAAAGFALPEGMRPQKTAGGRRRAEDAARRQIWKETEGMQHGTRRARRHIGETHHTKPDGIAVGLEDASPLVRLNYQA